MPLIECRQGPADVAVCGTTYQFAKDPHARHVCNIEDPRALTCFLARADMYREVPIEPPAKRMLWPGEVLPPIDEDDDAPVSAALDGDTTERRRPGRRPRNPAGEINTPGLGEAAAAGGE